MTLNTNAFEASDIEKITGINRPRLQQWLEKGFIIPSIQVASGPGTRNIYSIEDVYKIAGIKKIIEFGFTREKAAHLVNSINTDREGIHILFFVHNFGSCSNKIFGLHLKKDNIQEAFDVFKDMVLAKGGAYIFNYTKLMEEIDNIIEEIG